MNKVAYLVSDYFAPSHTFVRREVAALQKTGMTVIPFSIQPSKKAHPEVQCVLGRPAFKYIAALFWTLLTRPGYFLSSWRLSLFHRPPGVRGLVWSQFHFIEAMFLAQLLHKSGIVRLHNHFANSAATVGMIAAHFLNIPWSMTLHGISETDYPAGMLLGRKIERANFVACASFFMQAQAMRLVDFKHWSKMRIVRCGIDFEILPTARMEADDSLAGPVALICVGRLSAEKGYFGLLDSLARLKSDGALFTVAIVGDGPSEDQIRERVTALGLQSTVRFTGALPEDQTLAEINGADVLILPSLMEGLPVVLIEAMAMGKAVIAARIAGIPELIEEGETGLLFTPSDWQDLQRQISRILNDAKLRQLLGAKGKIKTAAEYNADQAAIIISNMINANYKNR